MKGSLIDIKGIKQGCSGVIVNLDKERDLFIEVRMTVIPVMKAIE